MPLISVVTPIFAELEGGSGVKTVSTRIVVSSTFSTMFAVILFEAEPEIVISSPSRKS